MKYHKKVLLKDGRECVIRNAAEADAEGVLNNFILTHAQTDYLVSYPDECTLTLDGEKKYVVNREESSDELCLLAEVGGKIVGTAGIDRIGPYEKVRHRAGFGISIDKRYWGLGIGKALTIACLECARKAGYLQVELEVVADNTVAYSLYTSVGFIEYGRNPKAFRSRSFGWQETILMRLEF